MISGQFHRFILGCAIATIFCAKVMHAAPGDGPPSVSVVESAIDAVIGKSLTLAVNAEGTHPLRYCWRKDGQVLPGETGSQLKINYALPSTAGAYTLEVANEHGSATSEVINVRVGGPSLRIYRHKRGIKVAFRGGKCVRYEVECTDALSGEQAWNVFAEVDRNGMVKLTDRAVPSHVLCVFRLKAEVDCQCGGEHGTDDEGRDLEFEVILGTSSED